MTERVLRYSWIAFFGLLITVHPGVQSSEFLPDEEGYIHEEVLPNGLTLLVKENRSAPVVRVNVYVKTGSLYEDEYMGCGISHHIEHLVSGGSTHSRTEAEYQEIISSFGGDCNAGTSTDRTIYYITSSAGNLPLMLEVLSEWIFDCIFDEKEYRRERGVIQREIEMGAEQPARRLWKLTQKTMFAVHPVRYPVIGYVEDFLRLTREDLVKYYERWYVPENTVVVIVGDVEIESTVELVKETFGKYPRRSAPVITLPPEPAQLSARVGQEEMDVKIAYLRLAYRTIPIGHPDLYALDLLSDILTNGESAILVKKIRDEMALVSEISCYSATPGYDAGCFAITAELDPEKSDKAQQAILEELESLKRSGIDKSFLERAKKQTITGYVFSNQTVGQQALVIGWNYLVTRDVHFYARYVESIQEVTQNDVKRVLNHYFAPTNLTIVKILPRGYVTSAREPIEKPVSHEIEKVTFDNGMTLLTKTDNSTPVVTILAAFEGGVLCETEENGGISNFVVRMLLKGTRRMSADDIARKIDSMGIETSTVGGNNSFYLGFSLLPSDLDEALALFADVVKNPTFPDEEVERMRERLLAEIARREGEWYYEAESFFRQTFFTDHPYRRIPEGTKEGLANITRQDLVDFRSQFCRPDNMVLTVFGDIEGLDVEKKVDKLFSGYKSKAPIVSAVHEPEPELTENRIATKQTEKNIAVIYMGYPGMRVDNLEDRYPMEVLDAVVSGIRYGSGTWLHEVLRGNELVYVVHAFNWMGLDAGYFGIYAATTPEKVDRAVDLILEQMARIKEEDIADDEFERAKGRCITIEKLSNQSNHSQALRSILDELYGLGYDFHKEHQDRIEAVTEADVKRVANKYLKNYVLITTTPE